MITLHTFGPAFGLPDPSAFVMKAHVLLKMAGQAYQTKPGDFFMAPKGKLPYLRDGDKVVADTEMIKRHLAETYGHDFEDGLTPAEKAQGFALERMCEDHLYFIIVHDRWVPDANFNRGPARFFDAVPNPVRAVVRAKVRGDIIKSLKAQGMGRHKWREVEEFGLRAVDALADAIGENDYALGSTPSGTDATTFSFVASLTAPHFDTPICRAARAKPNLMAYRDRCMARWFPDFANPSSAHEQSAPANGTL